MNKIYIDAWYKDEDSNKKFFVEIERTTDCRKEWIAATNKIANKYFKNPKLLNFMEPDLAKFMGYDIY